MHAHRALRFGRLEAGRGRWSFGTAAPLAKCVMLLCTPLPLAAQDSVQPARRDFGSAAVLDNPGFESAVEPHGLPPGWEISGEGYALDVVSGGAAEGRRSLVVRIDSPRGFARVVQRVEPPQSRADRWRLAASFRRIVRSERPTLPERSTESLRLRIDAIDGLLYVDNATIDSSAIGHVAVDRATRDRSTADRAAGESAGGPREAAAAAAPWRRFAVEAPAFSEAASVEVGATFQGPGAYWVDGFEIRELDTASLEAPSAAAKRYLDAALDVMQTSSIRRAAVDWPALKTAALRQLRGARTEADAHLAVRYAIALLGDRHSYLLSPVRSAALETEPVSNARTGRAVIEPRGERIAPGVGYVLVPGFAGGRPQDQVMFAQSLQDAARRAAARSARPRAASRPAIRTSRCPTARRSC
jgi:hypothetical protein